MASGRGNQLAIEFLVEPFTEGKPGPHVKAALEAFAAQDLDVELGPFSSSTEGDLDAVADALADMVRSAMRSGATSIRIQVGAEPSQLGLDSLHTALDDMVRAVERDLGASASEWDRAQKQAVVRQLHEQGAFLLRGAVDDIAEIMGVSRITIYNYLNAIEP